MVRRLLVVLPLLLIASSASAMTDEQRLAWYLPTAQAAWPNSPCQGHEQVTLRDDAPLDTLSAEIGTYAVGFAYGPCQVGLRSGLSDYRFCVVLTHEFGHVAGYNHSSDPENIMYATVILDYQPCLDRTALLVPYLPGRPQIVRRKHPRQARHRSATI